MLLAIEWQRPIDQVAEQHQEIDALLNLWGRAQREKRPRLRCGSAEKYYRPPVKELRPAPVELHNPKIWIIDRAILQQPQLFRQLLQEYYVKSALPEAICRRLVIHRSHFGEILFKARAGVINVMRRLSA